MSQFISENLISHYQDSFSVVCLRKDGKEYKDRCRTIPKEAEKAGRLLATENLLRSEFFLSDCPASHGEQCVVMLSLEEYKALEETAFLLRNPANAQRLLSSVAQLNAGMGCNSLCSCDTTVK